MLMVWLLGPMAVVPEYQRQGIGTKLIEAGNRKIKDAAIGSSLLWAPRSTILDSDPDRRSSMELSGNGIFPDEVFMLLVLNEAKMQGASGLAKYRHEFSTIS
jgi:putative acetyltransferase